VFHGRVIVTVLPDDAITAAAGVAFIAFGAWALRGDSLGDDDPTTNPSRWGPLLTVTMTFFIAELGDKAMLASVTLAAGGASLIGVWLGSTVGMVLADAIAIVVGMAMGKRIPACTVKLGAAGISLVTGLVTLATLL
jgi:putative Ca2+/H+ antiporter (TMEM165/GDT1 family)